MSNSLRVAIVDGPEHSETLESEFQHYYHVKNLKDLVRVLIEKDIDLVFVKSEKANIEKWKKISHSYDVPFVVLGTPLISKHLNSFCLGTVNQELSLEKVLENSVEMLMRFKTQRELRRLKFILEYTTRFTTRVIHTTKDLFIADAKSFFLNTFKLENCHWVALKSTSLKLPPILKLKQELENQKVDQGGLIKDLDNCSSEVAHTEDFQIWKTSSGDYMAMIWIHEDNQSSQCIVLNKIKFKRRTDFESFLTAIIPFLNRRWKLCLEVGEAQSQVYKDSLTSLYNQKMLYEVVARKIEEYRRYKTPFSILFIDVDHFKRVNDSLGHVVGSGVLQQMGELLKKQIRTSDFAFRYGGDEFIILLSHTEGEDSVNVAERIRKEVENSRFTVNGLKVRITVSIGLAFFPVHADSAEEIIRIADEAMYYGKNKSRNIVYKAS